MQVKVSRRVVFKCKCFLEVDKDKQDFQKIKISVRPLPRQFMTTATNRKEEPCAIDTVPSITLYFTLLYTYFSRFSAHHFDPSRNHKFVSPSEVTRHSIYIGSMFNASEISLQQQQQAASVIG